MSTDASAPVRALAAAAPVRLEAIEVRLIALTLVRPFETSFGRMDARVIPLVRMVADGVEGWGEIVADDLPLFSADTIAGAQHVLAEAFIPDLLGRTLSSVDDVAAALRRFKGHPMTKAGLELAFMDLAARTRGVSISQAIGGTRARVPVGVSLGIE
jgi:O-succinylbenzoate synthase